MSWRSGGANPVPPRPARPFSPPSRPSRLGPAESHLSEGKTSRSQGARDLAPHARALENRFVAPNQDGSSPPDSSLDAFDRLLEHHPDPAWIYDLESLRLLKVNQAMADLTGRPREELLRLTFVDLLVPGEVDRLRRIISRARS